VGWGSKLTLVFVFWRCLLPECRLLHFTCPTKVEILAINKHSSLFRQNFWKKFYNVGRWWPKSDLKFMLGYHTKELKGWLTFWSGCAIWRIRPDSFKFFFLDFFKLNLLQKNVVCKKWGWNSPSFTLKN